MTSEPTIPAALLSDPVSPRERVHSLDVLRGFALLGILIMNIQVFAMPGAAYMNPTVWGDLTGANHLVWLLSHLLADQKMMTIFSMLFGAGIVVFTSRLEARGVRPGRRHYRRTLWLLLFGALHAYLLWYGDILFLYAVCALVAFWCRRWPPRRLLMAGVLVVSVASATFLLSGWSMRFWPPEAVAEFVDEAWDPSPEQLDAELAAYRGGWLAQMTHRAPHAFQFQTFFLLMWGIWRAGGLMLIGMALYKLGVFSAARDAAFYWMLVAIGALGGLPIVAYGVRWNWANDWGPLSMFYGTQFNYWGSILVSLGWVGLVMLVCQRGALPWLTTRLAAVGQMAFTNYILHSVLCTTIFYGHGLGWFGYVERTGQLATVLGVWVLQLTVSPIWLRHYQFGPLEWLWRCLTYGRVQPIRRLAGAEQPVRSVEL
jgi:uncharacterized protein